MQPQLADADCARSHIVRIFALRHSEQSAIEALQRAAKPVLKICRVESIGKNWKQKRATDSCPLPLIDSVQLCTQNRLFCRRTTTASAAIATSAATWRTKSATAEEVSHCQFERCSLHPVQCHFLFVSQHCNSSTRRLLLEGSHNFRHLGSHGFAIPALTRTTRSSKSLLHCFLAFFISNFLSFVELGNLLFMSSAFKVIVADIERRA